MSLAHTHIAMIEPIQSAFGEMLYWAAHETNNNMLLEYVRNMSAIW